MPNASSILTAAVNVEVIAITCILNHFLVPSRRTSSLKCICSILSIALRRSLRNAPDLGTAIARTERMIVDVTMRKTVVMIVTAEIIVMKETIETEIEIIAIGIETKIAIENEKTARSLAQKRKIRRERDQNLQGRVVIGIHRREEL
jgi:hypothetical protein